MNISGGNGPRHSSRNDEVDGATGVAVALGKNVVVR